jgi:hypothetical protein
VQFIADLLEVTGNGRARTFADARDHALIRFLCEGVRRTEVTQLQMTDLSADLVWPARSHAQPPHLRRPAGRHT